MGCAQAGKHIRRQLQTIAVLLRVHEKYPSIEISLSAKS
jgi:hypothetical protein